MIHVLLADDHDLFAEGVRSGLDAIPDISVVDLASDGDELVSKAKELYPDVIVTDLEMPGRSGIEALGELGRPTIIVTMHATDEHRQEAFNRGAVGFLSKSTPLIQLAAVIRGASAGEITMDSTTLREVFERYGQPTLDPAAEALTARERELLGLLAEGITVTDELGERLFISVKTVKNHLANIYEKLGVSDRAQAALEAIRLGLVQPPK